MSHLSIRVLGALVVMLDGQAITNLAYNKEWALLVYLAHSTDHPHRRESLAGLLWPDQPEEKARANLRQALARLRKAIGDSDATPPFLLIERIGIQFNAAGDYTLDVSEFSALLAACASHAHRYAESCAACAQRRERAIALYRGAFLDKFYIGDSDLFEEWATLTRESLHQQAMDALVALVAHHERQGNYTQALHYSERQLELDPWREEAYRQMMRILALNGQRSAALRCYERCRSILDQELGVEPTAETTVLYEQIRAAKVEGPRQTDYLAQPTKHLHALPLPPTPFVGRKEELAALTKLIANPNCRLITLLGPGGTGKTRLALQAAREEGLSFADGAAFVSLAPLNAAEFIVPTVAAALNLTLANQATPETELLRYLRSKELLLLLDNFEHLLAPLISSPRTNGSSSATELLTAILQQAPGVKLLVTSRERLNVQGEWLFDVGGLEAHSAVALFLQTAYRLQKGFEPTAADQAAIERICQLVQGMPLALELAAAWVRVLSCREIAQEIEKSLGFLSTTLRDLPERHRSLHAVFDYSWHLLTVEEQHVFACCSVFRGGFTREAAEEVAGAWLTILMALVDKSLLRRNLDGRYEVHELVRQYAAARLAESQQEDQVRNRHLEFFMRFAEAAEPQIRSGQQVAQWHDWVEVDHDNVRAALDWSLNGGEFELGLRIVGALWEFWMNRGYAPEGQAQAERFLAQPEAVPRTLLRAKAAYTAGACAFSQGRYLVARSWYAEAAAISRGVGVSGKYVLALGLSGLGYAAMTLQEFDAVRTLCQEILLLGEELRDAWVSGHALYQLGILAWHRGDIVDAQRQILQGLECFQTDGRSVMRGPVLMRLGTFLYEQGDYVAAQVYIQESIKICEELGDKLRGSTSLTQMGYLVMAQGNDREAEELFTKALMLIRETGQLGNRVSPLNALGRLAQRQGEYERARALHFEALSLCIELGHSARLARTLEAFACLAVRQGQPEGAARLFGATEMYSRSTEVPSDPSWKLEHDQCVDSTRSQLGKDAFDAAWAAGQAMTLDEAVAFLGMQQWI